MAYLTRLAHYSLRLVWFGLLGLTLTSHIGFANTFKPDIKWFSFIEVNNHYDKNDMVAVYMPLMKNSYNGLWFLQGGFNDTSNLLAALIKKEKLHFNPEVYIGARYSQYNRQSLKGVRAYGLYYLNNFAVFKPTTAWNEGRHVGSIGIERHNFKTGQILHLNTHILVSNPKQTFDRQDQWRVDFKLGRPIPFVFKNAFLLTGPYYKCIRTLDSQENYWGANVEIRSLLLGGSAFVKYSYDQYDGRHVVLGWFSGSRAITPLTPENFM